MLKVHWQNPNIYGGAVIALIAMFTSTERHPEEPGSVYILAAKLFPREEGGRFLLCEALLKIIHSRCFDQAAASIFKLINTILATASLKGLGWLGPAFLEYEDYDHREVVTELLGIVQAKAKFYLRKPGESWVVEEEEEEEEGGGGRRRTQPAPWRPTRTRCQTRT